MIRLLFALVAGCCLVNGRVASAAEPVPFVMAKQYSAEMTVTTKDRTRSAKIFSDNGKMRLEVDAHGTLMAWIVRPDQQTMYNLMVNQKLYMIMPYDPSKIPISPNAATDGTFVLIGPETIDGVACTKYKVTSKSGKVGFMWVDAAKKVPVKMASEDGSSIILWKNVQLGPQDATLFEPPASFQQLDVTLAPDGDGGQ